MKKFLAKSVYELEDKFRENDLEDIFLRQKLICIDIPKEISSETPDDIFADSNF